VVTLVAATRNAGKLAELRRVLGPRVVLLSLDDAGVPRDLELPEPGSTYEDNARAKAEAVRDATGLPAIADDSGIEVAGLGGWPGHESARWLGDGASDRDRLLGLLDRVRRECSDDPRARYVAAVALAPARREQPALVFHGSCEGVLVEPRGSAGFGYDPAFLSAEIGGITFGQAADELKDSVSHRARALRALLASGALDAMSEERRTS
jgi:XTP/dITP diphosphohydrolase